MPSLFIVHVCFCLLRVQVFLSYSAVSTLAVRVPDVVGFQVIYASLTFSFEFSSKWFYSPKQVVGLQKADPLSAVRVCSQVHFRQLAALLLLLFLLLFFVFVMLVSSQLDFAVHLQKNY